MFYQVIVISFSNALLIDFKAFETQSLSDINRDIISIFFLQPNIDSSFSRAQLLVLEFADLCSFLLHMLSAQILSQIHPIG